MERIKLSEGEFRLMTVVWENEPVNSTRLAGLCQERLGWKKSTTYTVLKKLEEKGAAARTNATVTALVKREQIVKQESEALLEKAGGSLPDFFAAFLKDRKLTKEEAGRIRRMIEEVAQDEAIQ